MLTNDLLTAYQATRYLVFDGEACFEARVGVADAGLDRALAGWGAAGGIFITAWNPFSIVAPAAANAAAHDDLRAAVAALGYRALRHEGHGSDPVWIAEEGLFVLDLPAPPALVLARRFRQNAVMSYRAGEGGRLVLAV